MKIPLFSQQHTIHEDQMLMLLSKDMNMYYVLENNIALKELFPATSLINPNKRAKNPLRVS